MRVRRRRQPRVLPGHRLEREHHDAATRRARGFVARGQIPRIRADLYPDLGARGDLQRELQDLQFGEDASTVVDLRQPLVD